MPELIGQPWVGRRVLVTGAGGFIGSHLIEHLVSEGANVRALVRYNSRNDYGRLELCDPELLSEVEVLVGDLTNPEAVSSSVKSCEVVLHLGALVPIPYSYRHPREFVNSNVVGTLNVLEAARTWELSRIVHVSSSEVYGSAQTVPMSETHPVRAQSPYAATKAAADQLMLSFWHSFDLPVVIARPFNTYGPRQSARAVIPTIITQALTRDVIELGTMATTRDFLYVEDTAAALARCAELAGIEGQVFNFGTGQERPIAEVVERVVDAVGRNVAVVTGADRLRPPGSEVDRLVADISKAEQTLGWSSRIDFEEGLRRTIAWIESSLGLFKPAIYNV